MEVLSTRRPQSQSSPTKLPQTMQSPMSSSASVESFTSLVSNLGLRQKRSGTSNNTSVIKPVRSIKEINKHIEETQMKMFQESQKLPGIMREVQKVYDQTHETIELQLHHRRDIANKLNTCNQQYVNIFEQMLEEVMKMQRVKYKSHIALIEELREEMINFEQFVGQQHENLETSHNEKAGLRRELEDEKKNGEKLQGEIARLTNHIKHLEGEKVLFPMAGRAGANALSELELKNKMSAMKHEFKQQLEHKEKTHQLEVHSLKRINQELEQQIQEQLVTIEILRKESSVFSHIDKVQMKRPSKDSATQTEVNDDDGLWDRQDGWILPVSSYIIARARWRASLNFVTCPSCRGIGRYIAQVASELKRARMGVVDVPGLETSTITTGNNNNGSAGASNNGGLIDPTMNNVAIRKWILPDELILFLSNLPRSVQAINPFSLLWTAKRVYLILDGKLRADRDDFQMGFRPQSLVEYCIEIFLRNAPSRAKAEINLYVFIKSLKEHYQQCTLLKLFAKLLGVSDSSSNNSNSNNNSNSTGSSNNNNASNNNATNNKENSTNSSTRKTIRDKDNNSSNNSSSRQTQVSSSSNNHNSNSSKDKETTTPQKRKTKLENPYKDPEVFMNEHALSKEILAICLFARECLFSGPYNGVYAQAFHVLRQLRRVGEDFEKGLYKTSSKMFARTNKLPSNLNGTDALDSGNGTQHQHLPHGTTPNQTTYPLPSHVFVDALAGGGNSSTHASSTKNNSAHCVFYVPLDRAIHVIIPFMEQLSHNEVMSILHAMEDHTRILQHNQAALEGKIYNPEGQRSFVRSIVRLFAFSENHTARDIDDWQYLCDHYEYRIGEDRRTQSHGTTVHNSSKAGDKHGDGAEMEGDHKEDDVEAEHSKDDGKRQASHSNIKKSAKATSNNNKHGNTNPEISDNAQYSGESYRLPAEAKQHTLVIDAEYVLLIISEIARRKLISVEQQLKRIFEEGDVNHDNVLSFEEFSEIVFKVDAECPDRKILRMFREALILGGDKDVIGPQQYLTVCKDFNLIRLINVEEMAHQSLSALCRQSSKYYALHMHHTPHSHDAPHAEHYHHNPHLFPDQRHRAPHGSFNHHAMMASAMATAAAAALGDSLNEQAAFQLAGRQSSVKRLSDAANASALVGQGLSGQVASTQDGGDAAIMAPFSSSHSVTSQDSAYSRNQALLEAMKRGKKLPVNAELSKEMAEQMKISLLQRKHMHLNQSSRGEVIPPPIVTTPNNGNYGVHQRPHHHVLHSPGGTAVPLLASPNHFSLRQPSVKIVLPAISTANTNPSLLHQLGHHSNSGSNLANLSPVPKRTNNNLVDAGSFGGMNTAAL